MTGRDASVLGAKLLSAYLVISAVIELPRAIGTTASALGYAKTYPQVVVLPPLLFRYSNTALRAASGLVLLSSL